MSSALRTKVFEGHVMPRVQRRIADNPLRRHDQTLDFHRWYQIMTGLSFADANNWDTEPYYRIVEEAGDRRVLKELSECNWVWRGAPMAARERTFTSGATCRSKCKASRSTRAKEEEEQKLDESTEKAVQELLAERGVEELKAQPAVSSSSFKPCWQDRRQNLRWSQNHQQLHRQSTF